MYELAPGGQSDIVCHYHDEQIQTFYILEGMLHIETPEREYFVERDQLMFVGFVSLDER